MSVTIHPHAVQRASERGADAEEITDTVKSGEEFPAKFARTGFRKNFLFNSKWNGKYYTTKQIESYCVKDKNKWLVISIIVKYF